mgnify:CR=1 FL=1
MRLKFEVAHAVFDPPPGGYPQKGPFLALFRGTPLGEGGTPQKGLFWLFWRVPPLPRGEDFDSFVEVPSPLDSEKYNPGQVTNFNNAVDIT